MSIALRIFVVGCARSGTTILQACLAAHPRVCTFPESRLMRMAVAARPLARQLGLATSSAQTRLQPIYAELGFDPALCRRHLRLRGYVADFAACADQACLAAGKDIWLEKTPDHLHHVDLLARWVSRTRFVHILRNGFDNACSLLEITRKHRSWGPRPWTLEECLQRWREDAEQSLACLGLPDHLVLRYADLVEDPEKTLRAVDRFLGLDFHPGQITGIAPSTLAIPIESWKDTIQAGVYKGDPDQYRDLLPADRREWLLAETAALQARIEALTLLA